MHGVAVITYRAGADYIHAVGVIWRGGAGFLVLDITSEILYNASGGGAFERDLKGAENPE